MQIIIVVALIIVIVVATIKSRSKKNKDKGKKIENERLEREAVGDKKLLGPEYEMMEKKVEDMMEADRIGPRLRGEELSAKWAKRNLIGIELEKAGKTDEAINLYEQNVKENCDTPFSYKRLSILYRKQGKIDEEIRVLKRAISNNKLDPWKAGELEWRLTKAKSLKNKEQQKRK